MKYIMNRMFVITSLMLVLTLQLIITGACLPTGSSGSAEFSVGQNERGVYAVMTEFSAPSLGPGEQGYCELVGCINGWISDPDDQFSKCETTSDRVPHIFTTNLDKNVEYFFPKPNLLVDGDEITIALRCVTRQPYKGWSSKIFIKKYVTYEGSDSGGGGGGDTATVPDAPTNLSALAASDQIDLTWDDNSDNETAFRVERASSGSGTYTTLGQTSANTATYSDTTMVPDTLYDYRVFAFNAQGDSDASNEATVMLTAPEIPGSLFAVAISTQINLTWSDTADETSYIIERSLTSGSGFTQVGTSVADDPTFQDTTVAASTTYYYRVKGVRDSIESDYSSEAMVTSN